MNKDQILHNIEKELEFLEHSSKWPGWSPWALTGVLAGLVLRSIQLLSTLQSPIRGLYFSIILLGFLLLILILLLLLQKTPPNIGFEQKEDIRYRTAHASLGLLLVASAVYSIIILSVQNSLWWLTLLIGLGIHCTLLILWISSSRKLLLFKQDVIKGSMNRALMITVFLSWIGVLVACFVFLSPNRSNDWKAFELGLTAAASWITASLLITSIRPNSKLHVLQHLWRQLSTDLITTYQATVSLRAVSLGLSYYDFLFEDMFMILQRYQSSRSELETLINRIEEHLFFRFSVPLSVEQRRGLSYLLRDVELAGYYIDKNNKDIEDVAKELLSKTELTGHLARSSDWEEVRRGISVLQETKDDYDRTERQAALIIDELRRELGATAIFDLYGGPNELPSLRIE